MAQAAAAQPSSFSSRLYQLNPSMYGGRQEDFEVLSDKFIEDTVQSLKAGLEAQKDPTKLFFEVFENARKTRNSIAVKHQTEDTILFGTLRTSNRLNASVCHITPFAMNKYYENYRQLLMNQLHPLMLKMRHSLKGPFEDKTSALEETALGRKTSFKVEVFELSELQEKNWDAFYSEEELQEKTGSQKSGDNILLDQDLMKKLKANHPDFYKRICMVTLIGKISELFPLPTFNTHTKTLKGDDANLKSLFAIGTVRLELNGKMYALSQFCTWLYRTHKEDPVDRMKAKSSVLILHQDRFLIDDTLKEISKLFKKAIEWDSKTEPLQELKNRVALFRFLYAHCMPCSRGDGAIGDWFELAIYRYHGFTKTRFANDKMPNMEPLASLSLSHYLNRYDSIITVAGPDEVAPAVAAAAAQQAPAQAERKDDK